MTLSKKNLLLIAGLAIGGIGIASMMTGDNGDGDIPQQIKERAGKLLGGKTTTTTTGEVAGAKKDVITQPDVLFAPFPEEEDVFGKPIEETPTKPAAQRSGAGMTPAQRAAYDIMTGFAMGGGVYKPPKKEVIDRKLLAIAPAGVAAKGAIQKASAVEAQRISRAGVAGGGAITSFIKDIPSMPGYVGSRIGSAGAASSRAISGAVRDVTGISKKATYDPKAYWGAFKSRGATARVDPRTAAKYPGISKKEAASLSATKERLAAT